MMASRTVTAIRALQDAQQEAPDSVAGPSAADLAALEALNDVVVPPPIPWTPQTTGWYILAAIGAVALGALAVAMRRRWLRAAYRREALLELGEIEAALGHPEQRIAAMVRLPELLKRVALGATSDRSPAPLSGEDWTAFLDRGESGAPFASGRGALLGTISYGSERTLSEVSEAQLRDLVEVSRHWIKAHRGYAEGSS